jgi:hypothetical protein
MYNNEFYNNPERGLDHYGFWHEKGKIYYDKTKTEEISQEAYNRYCAIRGRS